MKTISEIAGNLWLREHKIGDGWHISHAHFRKTDKKPYVLLKSDNGNEFAWCVNCGGNGYYFRTKKEAKHFLWDSGWATKLYKNDLKGETEL